MFQTTNQMQYLGTVLSFDGLDISIDGFLESIPTYPMHKPEWKVHVPRENPSGKITNHKAMVFKVKRPKPRHKPVKIAVEKSHFLVSWFHQFEAKIFAGQVKSGLRTRNTPQNQTIFFGSPRAISLFFMANP